MDGQTGGQLDGQTEALKEVVHCTWRSSAWLAWQLNSLEDTATTVWLFLWDCSSTSLGSEKHLCKRVYLSLRPSISPPLFLSVLSSVRLAILPSNRLIFGYFGLFQSTAWPLLALVALNLAWDLLSPEFSGCLYNIGTPAWVYSSIFIRKLILK